MKSIDLYFVHIWDGRENMLHHFIKHYFIITFYINVRTCIAMNYVHILLYFRQVIHRFRILRCVYTYNILIIMTHV